MPYIILFIVLVLAGVIVINIIKKFFSKHAIGITIAITLLIAFVLAGLKGILWVIGILFAGIIIMYIMDSYKSLSNGNNS